MSNDTLRPDDFEPSGRSPLSEEPQAVNMRHNLSEVWRERPLFRVMVILLPVLAIAALVIGVLGVSKKDVAQSAIGIAPLTKGSVGDDVSQAYANAVDQANKQRAEAARQEGSSAIPTPTGHTQSSESNPTDPLAEFQTPESPPTPQPASAPPQSQTAPVVQQVVQLDPSQLSQAMAQQMQALMQGTAPRPIVVAQIAKKETVAAIEQAADAAQNPKTTPTKPTQGKIIVDAGTVLYGQLLTEANSDVPAPILVSILSGPLSGGRGIGSFQATDDYIILAFGTVIKDGKNYEVNGIAIDPDTTLAGLETSTDHHYFDRFVLPAAAAFIAGIGQVVANEGTSSSFGNGEITQTTPQLSTSQQLKVGLGAGAQVISNALQQNSNRRPTIHVAEGTPIGIFFTKPVRETEDQ